MDDAFAYILATRVDPGRVYTLLATDCSEYARLLMLVSKWGMMKRFSYTCA